MAPRPVAAPIDPFDRDRRAKRIRELVEQMRVAEDKADQTEKERLADQLAEYLAESPR